MVASIDICMATEEREKKSHAVHQASSSICSDTVTFLSFYSVVLSFPHSHCLAALGTLAQCPLQLFAALRRGLEGEPLTSGAALTLLSHLHA